MDPVQVYKLYRETESEVASLERCVREGKELDRALAFCRYVFWSGVVEILKAHQDVSVVKIDPYRLGGRVHELQSSVQEWYASNKKQPTVVLSEIEGINRKLDLIAGRLLGSQVSLVERQPTCSCNTSAIPQRVADASECGQAALAGVNRSCPDTPAHEAEFSEGHVA